MKLLTHLLEELLCPLLLQLQDTRTSPCVGCAAESSPIQKDIFLIWDHRIETIEFFFKFWNRFTSKMVPFRLATGILWSMPSVSFGNGEIDTEYWCTLVGFSIVCPINIFCTVAFPCTLANYFPKNILNKRGGGDPPMSCLLLLGVLKSGNDTDLQYFDFHLPEMTRYFLQLQ